MIYFLLAIGLILIVLLSFTIHELWFKYVNNRIIKIFLFPGTVIHELSHAIMCLATGTTIKELNLYSSGDKGIKYDRPKVPGIFDFIITSAPVFGCVAFIHLIPRVLSNPIYFKTAYPKKLHDTFGGFLESLHHLYTTVLSNLVTFKEQFDISNIQHILFLILMIIFTVSIAPQKQDIKYLITGFGILSGIFFFIEKFGVQLSKNSWVVFCTRELWLTTAITLTILVPLLFVTLIIMGFAKVYTVTFGSKRSGKGSKSSSPSR
ncbi:MAG: M50 family metallopeptidase [Candidatus Loosdrechtia sp.]|uniref:M50 family metallopeptidase n=1 Tax=Candidatus Loosdrechtia sp. TaxID=3101272 RepID=UPI003A623F3E|nr:MAG: M50 family metallopeptidase [Candidatus Jettenia sp. AMX2]